MKFIRSVIVTYNVDVSKYANRVAVIENMQITTKATTKNNRALLIISECPFDPLNINGGIAHIKECLYEAERGIENIADIIALEIASGRSMGSTCPGAALMPDGDAEVEILKQFSKWQDLKRPRCVPVADLRIDLLGNLKLIVDREDGLPLIAAMGNHNSAIGTLHDIVRIFERGFALSDKKLIKPLSEFLENGFGEYTHKEVHNWITELRHPATHADKREKYMLVRDVCSFIPRMKQAAYDIFINKAKWRGNDSERRHGWRPIPYIGSDNSIHIVKGMGAQMQFQLYDEFGSYPKNIEAVYTDKPVNWFIPTTEDPAPAPNLIVHAPA